MFSKMSQHHYNFTTSSSSCDSDMLVPIHNTPPPGLFMFIHGPQQVGEHQGCSFGHILIFAMIVDQEGGDVPALEDLGVE
jgi:hypothetical protein